MIPESAGATPYGIFILADDYLNAARLVMAAPGRRAAGPNRLLAYHSAELFLKTYMRAAGETIVALREQRHDFVEMVERSQSLGLKVPAMALAHARKVAVKNDYVRVRYVTRDRSDISVESVLRFAETIRSCVIVALDLDEYGTPRGRHWLGDPPSDYPGVVKT
jgi:hypothetical protein